MDVIRCPQCGKILGARVAGEMVIRHRGREWVGQAVSIRCERCGAVWRGEQVLTEHGANQSDENRTTAAESC